MKTVRLILLSSMAAVALCGCRKESDRESTQAQFVIAAVVQCLEPGRPERWSAQSVKWTGGGSLRDVMQTAAQELSAKNICRSRTGADLKDGMCWWIGWVGDEKPLPCTAGPSL